MVASTLRHALTGAALGLAALLAGARVQTGQCSGPLNHGHAPMAMQLKPL